jgi:hypothetical protein
MQEGQLKEALNIARRANIHGIEIQEIATLMEQLDFEERGDILIETYKDYPIKNLVYHYPFNPLGPNCLDIREAKKFDLASNEGEYVFGLTVDTIEEAGYVGSGLDIKDVPIVVHLFGYAEPDKITIEERNKKFEIGKKRLKDLKEIADHYSKKYGCKLTILRENEPPDHGSTHGLLDYDPRDVITTVDMGIGTVLDFAHIWQYLNYRKNGKGEFPGVDLSKEIYPDLSLKEAVEILAPSLKVVHLNDATGYRICSEGIEIGKGDVPHLELIPMIVEKLNELNRDITGTYEMKLGHKDPESMLRSDSEYRRLFENKFHEYFE